MSDQDSIADILHAFNESGNYQRSKALARMWDQLRTALAAAEKERDEAVAGEMDAYEQKATLHREYEAQVAVLMKERDDSRQREAWLQEAAVFREDILAKTIKERDEALVGQVGMSVRITSLEAEVERVTKERDEAVALTVELQAHLEGAQGVASEWVGKCRKAAKERDDLHAQLETAMTAAEVEQFCRVRIEQLERGWRNLSGK